MKRFSFRSFIFLLTPLKGTYFINFNLLLLVQLGQKIKQKQDLEKPV